MNRRKFGFMSACSLMAIASARPAKAGVSADKAALLKTTLTPMGSERAGNADGSIPPWTGGMTSFPPGFAPNSPVPDFFADEKPILVIDQSNYKQHIDRLTNGVVELISTKGFSLHVYPTHRTHAVPDWVANNIYQNALNASPNTKGIRFGFSGAYGGYPFPIPSEDENKGGEILWNHLCRWTGPYYSTKSSSFIVNNGPPVLTTTVLANQNYPYYDPNGSLATFNGWGGQLRVSYLGPPDQDGQELLQYSPTQPLEQPFESWQLLVGQGRVRKAPELEYDTPAIPLGGIGNYDELFGFYGSPDRYNIKFVEKKELYIPYNNNAMFHADPFVLSQPSFYNPEIVRWELHRVWVIDLTLAPGERNVLPHRRFYIDEDSWIIGIADEWDARGNIWRVSMNFNFVLPSLPGVWYCTTGLYDLQTSQYIMESACYSDPKYGSAPVFEKANPDLFNPNSLAAQSQF